MSASRVAAVAAGLWAGVLLCIALIATPAPFATLSPADAGRVVGRIFANEAYTSLVVALLLITLERRRGQPAMSVNVMLLLGTAFCTVAGYFSVQPLMTAARAGQGSLSFGALHAISLGFFALKGLMVLSLAWRLAPR